MTSMISVLEVDLLISFRHFWMNVSFRVSVGDTLSGPHLQEMGVPQGSILSVTLFSVKINNIVKSVCPGVECFLYVDDLCIFYRSKHMHSIERQLQHVLNNLSKCSAFSLSRCSVLKLTIL